jgi:hypothetical protein
MPPNAPQGPDKYLHSPAHTLPISREVQVVIDQYGEAARAVLGLPPGDNMDQVIVQGFAAFLQAELGGHIQAKRHDQDRKMVEYTEKLRAGISALALQAIEPEERNLPKPPHQHLKDRKYRDRKGQRKPRRKPEGQ